LFGETVAYTKNLSLMDEERSTSKKKKDNQNVLRSMTKALRISTGNRVSEPMVDPHGSVGIRRGGNNGEAKTAGGGDVVLGRRK